jgi:DNA-binding protein HU-beta
MTAPDLSTLTLPELRALDEALRRAIAAAMAGGGGDFRSCRAGRCRGRVGRLHGSAATTPSGEPDMARLNKGDLVAAVAAAKGLRQGDVAQAIDHFLDLIQRHTGAGDTVFLHRFGIFEMQDKPARKVRNPRTGEEGMTQPTRRLRFRASKAGVE